MAKISVLRGSVVYADTDAIVNAANAQLAGGSGVCGAIFTEAGWDDMQRACDRIGGCPTGQAVVTPGFKLKAKYVIHAVGPIYAGTPRDAELLRSAYRSCLEQAEKLGLRSIGFCSISTGIYGYPLNEAVKIAADTLRTFPAKSLTDIRIYCYGGGERTARQQKMFLNKHAKIIQERDLDQRLNAWQTSHPKAWYALRHIGQGYGSRASLKAGGSFAGSKSVFAAMLGYNVIQSGDYYTLLNRKAVTVSKTHRVYGKIDNGQRHTDTW